MENEGEEEVGNNRSQKRVKKQMIISAEFSLKRYHI
jgi:hypothetical protein